MADDLPSPASSVPADFGDLCVADLVVLIAGLQWKLVVFEFLDRCPWP